MKLISKISNVVLLLGLISSVLVTGFIAMREFSTVRDQLIEHSVSLVRNQNLLPLLISLEDNPRLQRQLKQFMSAQPVRYATIYDASGKLLVSQQRSAKNPYPLANYKDLRGNSNSTETASYLHAIAATEAQTEARKKVPVFGWLPEKFTDLTIPIFSRVSPLAPPASIEDFAFAELDDAASGSNYIVGYVGIGFSHLYLWQQVSPMIWSSLATCLVLVVVGVVVVRFYSRRYIGPLASLSEVAEQLTAKGIDSGVTFSGSGEAGQIANMLNTIIGKLKTYKSHLSVDHQLLSMKVEERNAQLSERDIKLSNAVTEVSRTKEDLHRMAYFDSLTGLPNRRLFTEQLHLLLSLSLRNNNNIALLFLDLDNFKRINDSLGHSAGDLLLREVGILLSNSLRTSDVISHYTDPDGGIEVSRLGGDEFTVILNQVADAEAAEKVAQRILAAMAAPVTIDGHELVISPSIGIAMGPRDAEEVEGLLKAADTAMYHAKSLGKNKYVFYSPEMKTSNVERLKMETEFRRAIMREELQLHYQPLVDINSGTVVGVEALIRWKHAEYGEVSPSIFVPMAEEMGLIVSIAEWTLEEACRCAKKLQDAGYDVGKIAVNISALAFSPALIDRVKIALAAADVDASSLELEMTEGVLMDSAAASIESLHALKVLGVKLSIDDFGTGYSSLSYLSHFPLDTLKIDRSFVTDYDKSDSNASLIVAIIAMAKSLNLRTVAEGVETEKQLAFLRGHGVSIIQGFLFSKAVPMEQLPKLLAPGYFMPQIKTFGKPDTQGAAAAAAAS